jgi:hypothetical protein
MPRQPLSVRPIYPFHVQGKIGLHRSNCGRIRGIHFGSRLREGQTAERRGDEADPLRRIMGLWLVFEEGLRMLSRQQIMYLGNVFEVAGH